MGVRPPPSSNDEEPETVAFGIAALDAQLDSADVSFPATRAELSRALGEREVPYDATGSTVQFDTVLDAAARDRFETRQELLNELHPVFEKRRREGGTNLLSQVRSMLPF